MKSSIYINGRFLTHPMTGVQRYAHELLNNFDLLLENACLRDKVNIFCLVPPRANIQTRWKNIKIQTIGISTGNLWEQLDLPLHLKGEFLFSPANTGPLLYRKQAITFHDASVFAVPHAYSFKFRLKHKLIFKGLSRLAQIIFTDSKFSQKELAYYLNQPLERYKVIHLAGDHMNKIQPEPEILGKHNLIKNEYILMVASRSPHKNLDTANKAIRLINGKIKIVLVGGYFQTVFNKIPIQQTANITVLLGYINDRELKALYQNALGYMLPSYYEGFGLPILEAMHCGCPVICSQAASLPEVAGEAALFFDPMDANAIAKAINTILLDPNLRYELIRRGNQRAKEFTWQSTANKTLNALMAGIQGAT